MPPPYQSGSGSHSVQPKPGFGIRNRNQGLNRKKMKAEIYKTNLKIFNISVQILFYGPSYDERITPYYLKCGFGYQPKSFGHFGFRYRTEAKMLDSFIYQSLLHVTVDIMLFASEMESFWLDKIISLLIILLEIEFYRIL